MESRSVRQLGADAMIVPMSIWQRIETMLDEFDGMRERLDVLEGATVTGSDYLSRQQAMTFLHVGSTKLWELRNEGKIETTDATGKTLYKLSSCREYLNRQGFSKEHIQACFTDIIRNKQINTR